MVLEKTIIQNATDMREYITGKIISLRTRITRSRGWQNLRIKHPKLYIFILRRITLKDFSGLPATLLAIAIAFNFIIMNGFAEEVINDKAFISIDNSVSKKLFEWRWQPLVDFFYFITHVGNLQYVAAVCIGAIAISLMLKKPHFIIPMLISLAGCGFSMYLGKNMFKVARPYKLSYYHVNSYAFPSGHTAIAVAFYGLLFYFFIRQGYTFRIRLSIAFAGLIFILLVAMSRLYLCVHFLSDVLGGFMLGTLWLMVSISTLEWSQYLRLKRKPVNYL